MSEAEKRSGEKFWLKLDNAGKAVAGQNKSKWSNIFRISFIMTEKIDPEILKKALEMVLPRFPCFDVRIRRGMFWYYLEKNDYDLPVLPDIKNPCYRVNYKENNYYLFRVYYYENRISVEFFHALTDGYGLSLFASTLTAQYLRLRGHNIPATGNVLDINEKASESEIEDAFLRFANSKGKPIKGGGIAYHRRGEKIPNHNVNITTGYIPLDELLSAARAKSVTITEYLASVLIYIHYKRQLAEEKKQKDISVQLPVNLRRSFPSETLRNFSLFYSARINPNLGEYTFDEILRQISLYLRYINNPKQLNAMMMSNIRLEGKLRALPLPVKNFCIRTFFTLTGEKSTTVFLSNLGKLDLPREMSPFVERVMLMPGPGVLNGARLASISYKNIFAVSFANIYKNSDIERDFFTWLVKEGMHVKIESNRD